MLAPVTATANILHKLMNYEWKRTRKKVSTKGNNEN